MWMIRDDQEYLAQFCDADNSKRIEREFATKVPDPVTMRPMKNYEDKYEIYLSDAEMLWDYPGIIYIFF